MRSVLIFAIMALAIGAITPKLYMQTAAPTEPATQARSPARPGGATEATTSGGGSLTLLKDARGHFQTTAYLDGLRLSFMVDT
ncbi:hypothetical protein CH340_25905, partial [Rhodoplanes serenus]